MGIKYVKCYNQTWASRTIYQVLTDRFSRSNLQNNSACVDWTTYCGGTWKGIEARLQYIQNLNFDAIWISPIVQNTKNGYHGYWLKNLYKLNQNFGNQLELQSFIQKSHASNIKIMLDVVANHVGPIGTQYTQIVPFNTSASYHTACAINQYQCFTNEMLHCRLDALPDLNQSDATVNATLHAWIASVTSTYGFDALRIDTVPFVEPSFWRSFVAAARVFALGETFSDAACAQAYDKYLPGILNYPLTYVLRATFQSSAPKMYALRVAFTQMKRAYRDLRMVGNFVESHDIPRFLAIANNDATRYRNALAYTLFTEGIPIVLYGTEQLFNGSAVPQNREPLWHSKFAQSGLQFRFVAAAVRARTTAKAWSFAQVERYVDDDVYVFTRGATLVAVSNVGANAPPLAVTVTFLPYAVGTTLCDIMNHSNCFKVTASGLQIKLKNGEPLILI